MTETPCPTCECWCCRDVSGMSVTHLAVRNSKHVCPDCGDGMVPAPVWTAEDERAAVVAWLRAPCDSPGHEDRFCAWCNVRQNLASEIERGEHHKKKRRTRREEKP